FRNMETPRSRESPCYPQARTCARPSDYRFFAARFLYDFFAVFLTVRRWAFFARVLAVFFEDFFAAVFATFFTAFFAAFRAIFFAVLLAVLLAVFFAVFFAAFFKVFALFAVLFFFAPA